MKYLCIHGHFYQPPRENAWLEAIEVQDSAAPFHDWNARITAECYGPNALARVLNAKGELCDLVDNYAHISFNFGPTLLSWMQEHSPNVYQAILDADKQSQKIFSGHGSAIAQVYNHIIMPLANARDKETQVKWGLADFKHRFGRDAEAMWLAETACDTPTLEVLASHGMKYVILAPGQCARVRKIGTQEWTDCSGARVDPKRAYLCRLPSGKQITLFFYDGPISQSIAFSDTLKSGENFAGRLLGTYDENNPAPQLLHIATDGETYGHHQHFADMALAYAIKHVEELGDVQLTVYGEYLEKYPPEYEAEIFENTSWSCFHGIERWRADCGCNSGRAGWHQKWRAPLRAALDFIRDEMAHTFDTVGAQYFKDPWAARNEYIELILDRSLDAQHRFFLRHATEKAWTNRSGALQLLEMQRNALLMYTSCGWFFDEISGLETVQIMQYAARALELHKRLGGQDLEPRFVALLAAAPSNIKTLKNGANVYEKYVKVSAMDAQKVAAQLALQVLTEKNPAPQKAYTWDVLDWQYEHAEEKTGRFGCGSVKLKNRVTLEEQEMDFVACQSQCARMSCAAIAAGCIAREDVFRALKNLALNEEWPALHEEIAARFGTVYPVVSLFKDDQRKIIEGVLSGVQKQTADEFEKIFNKQFPLLRGLKNIGAQFPTAFMEVAGFVLSSALERVLTQEPLDVNALESLTEDVRALGVRTDKVRVNNAAERQLLRYGQAFAAHPDKLERAVKLLEFLNSLDIFGFTPDKTQTQLIVFKALRTLPAAQRQKSILVALAQKLKIEV